MRLPTALSWGHVATRASSSRNTSVAWRTCSVRPGGVAFAGPIARDWLEARDRTHAGISSPYGFCVEFTLEGQDLAPETLRAGLEPLGDSLLVVGDGAMLHVHIHTDDPDVPRSL